MGIFSRLFKIGKAEANAAVDKLEDPIKMTDQGIRDLKQDLDKSVRALAEVKAMCIRAKNEVDAAKQSAADYENKAMLLLKRAESGAMDNAEADRLATLALQKKSETLQNIPALQSTYEKYNAQVNKLEDAIKRLKTNIAKWENEAKMLKARAKVSEATSNVNKQLAGIDSSDTVSMLEKMKEKVDQQEALAESYLEIADSNRTSDAEIDSALETASLDAASDLAALKAKMAGALGTGEQAQAALGQGGAVSDLDMLKQQMAEKQTSANVQQQAPNQNEKEA